MKVSRSNAILVSVQLPKQTLEEVQESLEELKRLVSTLGYKVVGTLTQARSTLKSPTVIGEGKIEELAKLTGGSGTVTATFKKKISKAKLKFSSQIEKDKNLENENHGELEIASAVIFDSDLTPSQLRNIESAVGVSVLDRTGVIIEIFSRHAKTRAAKLQIEIAKLNYSAPRLRETGGGGDRPGGGIGAKGVGESKVELDRRRIRDRIKELKTELAGIDVEQGQRRERRRTENSVALVGYTNAGKSSMMRALTASDVLIADQLFATLDTTVRPLFPETKPKILVSDTVGFIKKLPHDLIASFKTTLDEALNASLVLIVVDAADPSFRTQLEVTRDVLKEVGAHELPHYLVLNKADKLTAPAKAGLRAEFPKAIFSSTQDKKSMSELREKILNFFEKDMVDGELFIKYSTEKIIGEIRANLRVIKEDYTGEGMTLKVRGAKELIARFQKKLRS